MIFFVAVIKYKKSRAIPAEKSRVNNFNQGKVKKRTADDSKFIKKIEKLGPITGLEKSLFALRLHEKLPDGAGD